MSSTMMNSMVGRRGLSTVLKASSRLGSNTISRGVATLPELPYSYDALEPAISREIMELHHKKHHQTYVDGFNKACAEMASLSESASSPPPASTSKIGDQIKLQALVNFHGGGHINHSLFWENLAPASKGGGGEPTGSLKTAVDNEFGGVEGLKKRMTARLLALQGSGWVWLVLNPESGRMEITTSANQDPVLAPYIPLLGIDAWEHAYYLQYQNRKAEYFNAIWDVINWSTAQRRYSKP